MGGYVVRRYYRIEEFVKNTTPTEYQECVQLTHYLDDLKSYGKIVMFAHLVNELKINRKAGQKPNFAYLNSRKAEGWRPGVPDYLIVTPKKTLFIEMKRMKGSKVSDAQNEWLNALNNTGVTAVVCYGANEAIEVIEKYI